MTNMQNNSNQLNIDISDYALIIRKRFFQICLIFMFVMVAVILYTARQEPVFQTVCKVKFSARQPMATIEGAQITWYGAKGNELASEITLVSNKIEIQRSVLDILKHKEEAKAVRGKNADYYKDVMYIIKKLNFANDEKKYINGLTPEALSSMIKISNIPQSNIILLKVHGPLPNIIEAVANTLAIVYRADYWRSQTKDARETMNFIKDQYDKLEIEFKKSTKEALNISKEDSFMGSKQTYQAELANMYINLNKLKEKYTDIHPKVIKQVRLITNLKRKLGKFPKKELIHSNKLNELKQKQKLSDTLSEHFLKAQINYEAKRLKAKDEIEIISESRGSSKLKPNEKMNMIVGAIFGIILGCIFAFVWEGLDTSIGKIEDVENITGLPVIAHIPVIGKDGIKKSMVDPIKTFWKHFSRFFFSLIPFSRKEPPLDLNEKILFNYDILSLTAEAYRTLRTNIQFAIGTIKSTGNVISITSTSPREGKTLTSTNLAITLAQMGKATLLVEADMRRPQIAPLFKIDKRPGLSDLLIGTAKLDNTIRTFTDILMGGAEWDRLVETQGLDNLHLIPCGTIPPNPSELLLSKEFKTLIEDLRKIYDFVIIDTPPTLPVSDSSIVGTVVDGTVLIYQSDTTSRHLLLRVINTLKKNHANLLGIVINQLSFDVIINSTKYGYPYREDPTATKEQKLKKRS